jgi:hypothetical protein
MDDATGRAEALLGLSQFRVLASPSSPTSCGSASKRPMTSWGARAVGASLAHECRRVDIRDLPCFGRPARLI